MQELANRFPLYKDRFPMWSNHSNVSPRPAPAPSHDAPLTRAPPQGMLQFVIWTALEKEGLGATLQVRTALPRTQLAFANLTSPRSITTP